VGLDHHPNFNVADTKSVPRWRGPAHHVGRVSSCIDHSLYSHCGNSAPSGLLFLQKEEKLTTKRFFFFLFFKK